ncbi:MAG: sodium/solute symporter [Phycisphaeraceae bacterium]|nr:sodium/solute symporter [Phycisphaeraceae bacterium]
MLSGIDYFIVIAYLVGILLLGIYFRRFVHSSKDFFLGGRMLPFWAIGMSIVVSDIGAQDFVGVSGQAYRYGIAVGNFDWIGSVPAMLLAAFIFIPYFWKAGLYTIPEYLGRRYNDAVRTLASLTWIIFFAFNLGVVFWASALLLKTLMGWPPWLSIILTATIVGAYTFMGGLTAVVMTDVVQMIIMFTGGTAVVILGFIRVGGWHGLVEKVSATGEGYETYFNLIQPADTKTPFPWTGILFGLTFVMANAYMIGNQAVVQRCLAAKNEWHAKASMVLAAVLKMCIPMMVLFPGLMALVLLPGLEDGDTAFPRLIVTLLPPGLGGLMFAALLAGLMSSIDSMVNSTATLWTKDIYEKFLCKHGSDQHYLWVGKITTVVLLGFGILTSPVSRQFPGIYVAIQTFLSFFQGPIFSILLLGMFFPRITQWGGLVGLVGGISSSALMYLFRETLFTIQDPFLYVSWWSFVVGIVLTLLVSCVTRPHPAERLAGLVFRVEAPNEKEMSGSTPC